MRTEEHNVEQSALQTAGDSIQWAITAPSLEFQLKTLAVRKCEDGGIGYRRCGVSCQEL